MEIATLLITFGFILQIVAIFVLFKNSIKRKTRIIKTNNPEDLKQFMEENNFPTEILEQIKNKNTQITSTKTVRTVKYVNGEKISDETQTINNNIPTPNFCPNCGASFENNNSNICPHCNNNFTITK